MRVTVRYTGMLRAAAGTAEEAVALQDGAPPVEILKDLARRHPAARDMLFNRDGSLAPQLHVLRNGRRLHGPALDAPLADGDVLSLAPAIAGGTCP